ncbi:hypothetical protein [Hyphomicrobium sp. DY-1]
MRLPLKGETLRAWKRRNEPDLTMLGFVLLWVALAIYICVEVSR